MRYDDSFRKEKQECGTEGNFFHPPGIEHHMWHCLTFLVMLLVFSAKPVVADVDHTAWDSLLKQYVDGEGRVAYRNLKEKDLAVFKSYLETLATAKIDGLSVNEEKALWINAYNAAIVNGVLEGYSAEGIIGRKQFFSWYTLKVAGKDRTPDEIEHQILRPKFNDPRIHFAIVCASASCPKLRTEAFVAEHLDAQLDDATRRFINDPSRNQITPGQLAVSKIFEWFAEDFVKKSGSVANFIQGFVDTDKQAVLKSAGDELDYLDYDWTLNAQDGQRVS